MKIYVAGKFTEWRRTRQLQRRLVAEGHTITCDWTVEAEHEESVGRCPTSELLGYAYADVRGVLHADVLVFEPHPQSKGVYVELGLALGRIIDSNDYRHRIIGIGGDAERQLSIFHYLPQIVWVDGIEGVVRQLRLMEAGSKEAA